jgi:hypothetical protein
MWPFKRTDHEVRAKTYLEAAAADTKVAGVLHEPLTDIANALIAYPVNDNDAIVARLTWEVYLLKNRLASLERFVNDGVKVAKK